MKMMIYLRKVSDKGLITCLGGWFQKLGNSFFTTNVSGVGFDGYTNYWLIHLHPLVSVKETDGMRHAQ